MAFAVADRVKETSTTTGTGTYNLAGAVTGFQTFVAGIGTTNTCFYCAENGIDWEVGIGTVTDASPDTLARTTILQSSNADAAVSWAAGTKTIFVTIPEQVARMLVADGNIKFPATQNASADANTLDDYEEGTFTPAFSAAGGTYSYASQLGTYTKIGRLVFFKIELSLNTSGNTLGAANLSITGLPFTSLNAGAPSFYPLAWFAATATYVQLMARLSNNATTLTVVGATVAATDNVTQQTDSNVLHATNGSVIRANGVYLT